MADTKVFTEREMKFDSDLAFELPDLREVVGRSVRKPTQELSTVYYDTPDFRLWERAIIFRYRANPGDEVGEWTLKLPSRARHAALQRTELSWSGQRESFPPEATRILRGVVRRSTLEQVVELLTTRRRFALGRVDSSAELDDDVVTVIADEGPGRARFRQLEVEFGPEDKAVAAKVSRAVRRAGARRNDEPKLAKALGLEAHRPPELDRRASVGDVFRATLRSSFDRILDHDYALRVDPERPSPHDVHQARVATRRLRSDLKTLRPALDPVWLSQTRAELQWLGTVLGTLRDLDVLFDDLGRASGGADGNGPDELLSRVARERRAASRELTAAMAEDRYLDLLDRIHGALVAPPFDESSADAAKAPRVGADSAAARVLPSLVAHQWRTLQRRVRKGGRQPTDGELHRIRIGAKQLRYASEMATPVIGARARRTAEASEHVQTILGEHHDAAAAKRWRAAQASDTASSTSFWAGRLWSEHDTRQKKLRRRWRSAWTALDDNTVLRWLKK
jgi:CHAD domain-containing protein